MNASDQAKLAKVRYAIIHRQDSVLLLIKFKSSANPYNWHILKETCESKVEHDRHAKRLLTQEDIIED